MGDTRELAISLFTGVTAQRDGEEVALGGPRQRGVLALLAQQPGTPLSGVPQLG